LQKMQKLRIQIRVFSSCIGYHLLNITSVHVADLCLIFIFLPAWFYPDIGSIHWKICRCLKQNCLQFIAGVVPVPAVLFTDGHEKRGQPLQVTALKLPDHLAFTIFDQRMKVCSLACEISIKTR